MSRKSAVALSAGAAAILILAVLVSSLFFRSPGPVKAVAKAAPSAAILTGRDDAGRLPTELLPGAAVNINTASREELQLLPGIGEILSQAILDYREANGPFESTDALMEVPGIGPGRFAAVADQITIGETP